MNPPFLVRRVMYISVTNGKDRRKGRVGGKNMMGYGMMGGYGFGLIFMLLYLAAVVYFFVLLTQIARSLKRIAASLERNPSPPRQDL